MSLSRFRRVISALLCLWMICSFQTAARAQNILPQSSETSSSTGVRWKALLSESLLFLGMEQGFRIATEEPTRDNLPGRFFP